MLARRWLGFLVCGWLLAAQTPAPFTVEVPVLVLDRKGTPVMQLDQDLFRLTDDGRPQRLARFDREARPVSLAIVVDTSDRDAIAQMKRSAELLSAMVVGDLGEATIYSSGPSPRQVLPYTSDSNKIVNALTHLEPTPTAPLGQGLITTPANQALLELSHRPDTQARAVLIVAKDADRSGLAAQALVNAELQNAISIFLITPNKPDGAADYVNPDTPAVKGNGQGSQRDPYVIPNGAKPGMPGTNGADSASINLTPILSTAKNVATAVVAPHQLDYVYDSGGFTLNGGNNAEFDRNLNAIGSDLRSLYFLYYRPDDLAGTSLRHTINVSVLAPEARRLAFRRAYIAKKP
ncbi:MAG TPA: hypothetical protein VN709_08135 [Terriglobales bacterium]|nr:hypothetical protein [Terriglobales bacterium]